MATLFVFRDAAIVEPAIAMSRDLVAGSAERQADFGGELQGPAHGEGCQRQGPRIEQFEDAPDAGP
ncbi:hypothetical protein D3C81_1446660 [compost metagenome]